MGQSAVIMAAMPPHRIYKIRDAIFNQPRWVINEEEILRSQVYGIRIDMTNSDPTDAVIYTEDSTGFEPLYNDPNTGICSYGNWQKIIELVIGCKPCMYLNGERTLYLDPDNYAQDIDGNAIDITSGNAGDVMVEFRKCFYRWRADGDYLYFELTGKDMSDDSSWCCNAFKGSGGTIKDYMYYSAYEGYTLSSRLRSLSGKTPTVSQTISTFRTQATANGDKYQQEEISKRMYLIGLIFLVTKSRDGQATLGAGFTYTDGDVTITTGTCDTKGLFFGTSSTTQVVKVFGIENFWGSLYHWCEGFISASLNNIRYKEYGPYNNTGTDYSIAGNILSGNSPKVMTNLGNGIIAALNSGSGSSSTYFPDKWSMHSSAGYLCRVGGYWYDYRDAGPLCCVVSSTASSASTDICARLVAC